MEMRKQTSFLGKCRRKTEKILRDLVSEERILGEKFSFSGGFSSLWHIVNKVVSKILLHMRRRKLRGGTKEVGED